IEAGGRLGAAGEELGALLDAALDVAANALALDRRDQRAEGGLVRERIADDIALRELDGEPLDLREALARHEHARQRAARLTGVEVAAVDACRDGLLEPRVVEDPVRRLAAELDGHRLAVRSPGRPPPAARAGRAGEGDRVDPV